MHIQGILSEFALSVWILIEMWGVLYQGTEVWTGILFHRGFINISCAVLNVIPKRLVDKNWPDFFFFLLVCFSWTRINLLKSVCLWDVGICVEGGGRYIYLPNSDFLRKASWFLQELSQQWLTVALDSFSLSPCSLPDISHRIIFPWRTYCIWNVS